MNTLILSIFSCSQTSDLSLFLIPDMSSHYNGLDSQLFTGYPWLNWRDDAIKKNMTIREKRNVRDFAKSYNLAVFLDVVEFFLTCMVGAPIKMKQTIEIFPSGAFACNPLYFDKLKWFVAI